MSYSIHDILMISLQFFYAIGGLILMGSLIFSIMKNQALVNEKRLAFEQDFEVELTSQLAQYSSQGTSNFKQLKKERDTTREDKRQVEKRRTPGKGSGHRKVRNNSPLKNQVVSVGQGVVSKGRQNRYRVAASMAARGFNAKDIGEKVGLPQCEVDLIASLNTAYAKGRWENHQSMLDAIDSSG